MSRPPAPARRVAPSHGALAAPSRALTAAEVAWLSLLPTAALAVAAMALLAKPLGRLMVSNAHYHFFPSIAPLVPVPIQQASYLLAVVAAGVLAATVVLLARRSPRTDPRVVRVLVLVAQGAGLAFVVWCWIAQHHRLPYNLDERRYFTPPSVLIALALALGTMAVALRPSALAWLRSHVPRGPGAQAACLAGAVLLTAVWLLPSIFTDGNIGLAPIGVTHHIRYTFDESMAVLNGRSPLVDFAGYTALWPYATALPLMLLGASIGVFTTMMTSVTLLALLAIYGVLRRVARNPLAALALYVPFLATSLFVVHGSVERYTFGNYYAEFPLRYAGPYALMWLAARRIDGQSPRRLVMLFTIAGLVAVNNVEFGFPALVATAVALLAADPPRRWRDVLPLVRAVALGFLVALALVSLLILVRAGTLPHFGVFLQYAKVFGIAGFGRIPVPRAGVHVIIALTLAGALVAGAVRFARAAEDRLLTAMLLWIGIFGLGAGQYYSNRPGDEVLIAFFSVWALALALLAGVVVRSLATGRARWPLVPELAVLLGFGLTVCSIAQLPVPWAQVQRLGRVQGSEPMKLLAVRDFVASRTHRGEHVALFLALGHRVAYEAGVVDVERSAGLDLMPTAEQVNASLDALRAEGGRKVFIGEFVWPEMPEALARAGFRPLLSDRTTGFSEWLAPAGRAHIVLPPGWR